MINNEQIKIEMRGENGLSLNNSEILRESIVNAKNSTKSFKNGADLIIDASKD